MREYLFRGRRIDNKEWIEGYLLVNGEHAFIAYYDNTRQYRPHKERVDPATIGQYIQKEDFYEGDVLSGHESESCEYGSPKIYWTGEVKYDEDAGRIRVLDCSGDWYETDDYNYDEVIGTIHDEVSP